MTRATLARTGDRWTLGIDGAEQGDFALFQHNVSFSEFRRTSRGIVESIFVIGLPVELGERHSAEVVSMTHPDAWPVPDAEKTQAAPNEPDEAQP